MSVLSSNLTGELLPAEKLPPYAPHHKAKHQLLREYMPVWVSKLGFTYGQVALIDGFASAGRYAEGQKGSPLIMLDAYAGRSAADRARFKSPPHFVFIESKKSFARHLQAEIDAYPELHGATVDVVHGEYQDKFLEVVQHLRTAYDQPVPVFAFVDPRGYADNPFTHIATFKARMPKSTEAMIYLPASFMARFLATGQTDEALTKTYGGLDWEAAKVKGDASRREVGERLATIFYDRLKNHFDWVTSFNVEPERQNDYYLLFGTDHKAGLRAMKKGMWTVDRRGGKEFRLGKVLPNQPSLFSDEEVEIEPDNDVLIDLLRAEFGSREFGIEEAEAFTLFRTKYLDSPHLRSWVLVPLEKEGKLRIVRAKPRRRAGTYPPGTRLQFVI